jgi:hypothetical protein
MPRAVSHAIVRETSESYQHVIERGVTRPAMKAAVVIHRGHRLVEEEPEESAFGCT